MRSLRMLIFQLLATVHWRKLDTALDEEIRIHLEQLEDDHRAHGLSPQAAREAAQRDFGGVAQIKDLHRDNRPFVWFDDLRRDVYYAFRSLRRNRGFTTAVVLTLALGIGANTAIFSVVNALLLQPLPYKDADRILHLSVNLPPAASPTGEAIRTPVSLSAAEMNELQSTSRTLSHVGTAALVLRALIGHEDGARLPGARVSASIFGVIGARPLLGRSFSTTDEAPGAAPVVLLSHAAWLRLFGGNPNIIGDSVTLDSVLGPRVRIIYSVIGVMPPEFQFPVLQAGGWPGLAFWIPFQLTAAGGAAAARGAVVARLADDVSVSAALSDITPIIREMRKDPIDATYDLVTEQAEFTAPIRPALLVLTGAVAFVLLLACVNVANLSLARMTMRQREIGIRMALGGGRGRIVRQVLTESVVLALLGGISGTLLAIGGTQLLQRAATTVSRVDLAAGAPLPRFESFGIDVYVLLFTLVTSVATGFVFGLAPVAQLFRSDPVDAVRPAGTAHRSRSSQRRSGMSSVLVVTQITLATVLLVGAGLLIHSFIKLLSVNPGFDPDNVLTFQVSVPNDRYPDSRLKDLAETLVDRLRSVPGVAAAAYANQLPMVGLRDSGGGLWRTPDPQRPPSPGGPDARLVSQDYFKVMRIRVIAGRDFTEGDEDGRPRVLLVNEALARREFAGQNPLGTLVYVGRDPEPWEIVGVVENVRQFGLDREAEPQFFADLRQWPATGPTLFPVGAYYAVRTDVEPATIVPAVRRIVRELDDQAALFYVAPMEELVASTIARPRMYAVLLSIFAAVGFVLAVIGIYGVIAYSVAQRTRELGIRMALGAQRGAVLGLVLRQGFLLTVAGIVIGLAGAAGLSRYMEGMLFEITPADTSTYIATALIFGTVAVLATALPAQRACRISPLTALRHE